MDDGFSPAESFYGHLFFGVAGLGSFGWLVQLKESGELGLNLLSAGAIGLFALAVGWLCLVVVDVASSVWACWEQGRYAEKAVFGVGIGAALVVTTLVGLDAFVENRRPGPEITAAASRACLGQAVAGAGAYDAATGGSRLVVLDLEGNEHAWTGQPPIDWRPSTISELKLVACIAAEEVRHVIQTCRYQDGPDITRYTAERRVIVVEGATARPLSDEVVRVSPRQCEQTERRSVTELVGLLDWETLEALLSPYVEVGG